MANEEYQESIVEVRATGCKSDLFILLEKELRPKILNDEAFRLAQAQWRRFDLKEGNFLTRSVFEDVIFEIGDKHTRSSEHNEIGKFLLRLHDRMVSNHVGKYYKGGAARLLHQNRTSTKLLSSLKFNSKSGEQPLFSAPSSIHELPFTEIEEHARRVKLSKGRHRIDRMLAQVDSKRFGAAFDVLSQEGSNKAAFREMEGGGEWRRGRQGKISQLSQPNQDDDSVEFDAAIRTHVDFKKNEFAAATSAATAATNADILNDRMNLARDMNHHPYQYRDRRTTHHQKSFTSPEAKSSVLVSVEISKMMIPSIKTLDSDVESSIVSTTKRLQSYQDRTHHHHTCTHPDFKDNINKHSVQPSPKTQVSSSSQASSPHHHNIERRPSTSHATFNAASRFNFQNSRPQRELVQQQLLKGMALVGTPPRYLKMAEGEQAKAKDAGLKGHVSSSASFLTRPMGVVTNREAELGSLPLFSLKDNRNDSNKLSSSRLYQVRGKEKAAAVLAFLLQKQEIETKQQQQADTNTTNSQTGWIQLREKVVPSPAPTETTLASTGTADAAMITQKKKTKKKKRGIEGRREKKIGDDESRYYHTAGTKPADEDGKTHPSFFRHGSFTKISKLEKAKETGGQVHDDLDHDNDDDNNGVDIEERAVASMLSHPSGEHSSSSTSLQERDTRMNRRDISRNRTRKEKERRKEAAAAAALMNEEGELGNLDHHFETLKTITFDVTDLPPATTRKSSSRPSSTKYYPRRRQLLGIPARSSAASVSARSTAKKTPTTKKLYVNPGLVLRSQEYREMPHDSKGHFYIVNAADQELKRKKKMVMKKKKKKTTTTTSIRAESGSPIVQSPTIPGRRSAPRPPLPQLHQTKLQPKKKIKENKNHHHHLASDSSSLVEKGGEEEEDFKSFRYHYVRRTSPGGSAESTGIPHPLLSTTTISAFAADPSHQQAAYGVAYDFKRRNVKIRPKGDAKNQDDGGVTRVRYVRCIIPSRESTFDEKLDERSSTPCSVPPPEMRMTAFTSVLSKAFMGGNEGENIAK
eukprot:jgi/Bigna1/90722/estExt_fgenesh1_pg.C_770099